MMFVAREQDDLAGEGGTMRFARLAVAAVGLALGAAACGGDGGGNPAAGRNGAASVTPTGDVVEVLMVSGRGEIFDPGHVTVRRGDVLRFKLEMGVHNASWPADRNPSGVQLPEATPYLQIPGQTHDLLIDMPPGDYTFICDPHAALGMVGTVTVVD
jgi:plastocyanin